MDIIKNVTEKVGLAVGIFLIAFALAWFAFFGWLVAEALTLPGWVGAAAILTAGWLYGRR